VISAIAQTGVSAAKPTGAHAAGSSDIFLRLLTQEFQTSNGLVDPSLSNLNASQPGANAADLNKIDPNAQDGSTLSPAAADPHAPMKKAAGKDGKEAQSSKTDDPNTPGSTVLVPTAQVLAAVPLPIQLQPNANATANVATSVDDGKKSDQPPALTIPGLDGASGQASAVHLASAKENSKDVLPQSGSSAGQSKNVDDAGKDELQKSSDAGLHNAVPAVIDGTPDTKPSLSQIAKPAISDSIAAPKRPEGSAHKNGETAPLAGSTPSDSSAVANDPTAIALNAAMAVPNQAADPTVIPNNRFSAAKLTNAQSSSPASQVADGPEKKTKDNDPAAAIKSAFRKDEGQLGQQDGQQPAAPGDQQAPAAADSAFHSAVVQQLHGAVSANSTVSHSSPDVKTAASSNNLQSPLQQNTGAAHDAALPVTAGLLQSVKLVEKLGQSELRVGLQVGDMGGVDIRTSMAHNQLTAEISVERPELGHLLEANLPSLQNRLSEHQFQTTNILLQNQMSGSFAGSGQRNQQGDGSQKPAPIERIPFAGTDSFSRSAVSSSDVAEANAGLDIHI